MSKFVREEHVVNGVRTVVHTAGKGEPLVFFHGGGTVDGFDFSEPWADQFKVIVPHHPGFTDIHDYVLHYLDLFDTLKIDKFCLTGISMGAYLAAKFAIEQGHRVRKLVLVAPYGLDVPGHPPLDIIATPGEQLVPMLVSNFEVLKKRLPEKPDMDFIGARYREATTFARLFWEHPFDHKFSRHLHRLRMPVMLVWGEEDKVMPVGQVPAWKEKIPHAEVLVVPGGGHIVYLDKPETVAAIARFLK